MPQYQCLRCCSCLVYQAKQVTKNAKFSCSRCGTKQTVQHIYAVSDHPKDIRLHVARLNMDKGLAEEQQKDQMMAAHEQMQDGYDSNQGEGDDSWQGDQEQPQHAQHPQPGQRRITTDWAEFTAGDGEGCDTGMMSEGDDLADEDPRFVTSIQDRRGRGRGGGRRGGRLAGGAGAWGGAGEGDGGDAGGFGGRGGGSGGGRGRGGRGGGVQGGVTGGVGRQVGDPWQQGGQAARGTQRPRQDEEAGEEGGVTVWAARSLLGPEARMGAPTSSRRAGSGLSRRSAAC